MPVSRKFLDKDGNEQIVTVEDRDRTRCQVWSRVVGYYRPMDDWNSAKKAEWTDRTKYEPPQLPDMQPTLPHTS